MAPWKHFKSIYSIQLFNHFTFICRLLPFRTIKSFPVRGGHSGRPKVKLSEVAIQSDQKCYFQRCRHWWQPKVKLDENSNIEKADIPSPLWLSQETFSMTAAAGGITRVKIRFNLTSNRNKLPITKFDSVPFLFLLY